jgi:pimeloyl-ACP methyl ester carboxylesterase
MSGLHMTNSVGSPTSHYYLSQRLRMHYLDWGNAGAPPLVLLHGTRDHCRNWDWVVSELRQHWHVITPDLRGHGDSQWSPDGFYSMPGYIYDLAELVEQLQLAPVTLVGHSLGGTICVRYAGIYPDKVRKLVSIEGLGPSPQLIAKEAQASMAERMQKWIGEQRQLAERKPRRYASMADACQRMQEENKHLSPAQATHLTEHGVTKNDDGTYSWKFDNYLRSWPPIDMPREQIHTLWARINCPALLIYGKNSWASNPAEDGRALHFKHATVVSVDHAGHWVHHDQLPIFMTLLKDFL